jgi:hypothetical protein
MLPLKHIAPLMILSERGDWEFAGTAFCFRAPEYLITAGHCVGSAPAERVGFLSHADGSVVRSVEVITHKTADVAIVRVAPDVARLVPFWDFVSNYSLGEQFLTSGFPYEDIEGGGKRLLPRLFMGIFQRIFDYTHGPWSYTAAELSAPAPMGLSGGPLFRPGAPQMLTAVVTANFESQLVIDHYEEVQREGTKTVYRTAKVTTYGVALLLDRVADWLNQHLPRSDSERYASAWRDR